MSRTRARVFLAKFPAEISFSRQFRGTRRGAASVAAASSFVWRSLRQRELKKLQPVGATRDFNNSRGRRGEDGPDKTESERKNRSRCGEPGTERNQKLADASTLSIQPVFHFPGVTRETSDESSLHEFGNNVAMKEFAFPGYTCCLL